MSIALHFAAAALVAVVLFQSQPTYAKAGTVGTGEEIPCPQTLVSPEAQARIDKGEKPATALSLYKPGILSNNGFCRVVVADDGKLVRTYNEGASVSNIPLRLEFWGSTLQGYVGPKAAPFGKGSTDIMCFAPNGEFRPGCSTSVDQAGAMRVGFDYDRNISNIRLSINPEALFGTKVETPNISHHTSAGELFSTTGVYYMLDTPDCTKSHWQNLATVITATTGVASAQGFTSSAGFQLAQQDEFTPDIVAASFEVSDDIARSVVDGLLAGNAVKVVANRACETDLTATINTDLLRVTNQMFGVMHRQLVAQNIQIERSER